MNTHPAFITVTQGMSGYFAVMMAWSNEQGGFYEPAMTGMGRYKEKSDAENEAKGWAEDDELEYRP